MTAEDYPETEATRTRAKVQQCRERRAHLLTLTPEERRAYIEEHVLPAERAEWLALLSEDETP